MQVKWAWSGGVMGGASVGRGLRAEWRQRGGEHQNLGLHEREVRQRRDHLGRLLAQVLVLPRLPVGDGDTREHQGPSVGQSAAAHLAADSPGGRAGLLHGGHEAGEGVGHPAAGATRVQLGRGEFKELRVHA